MARCNCNGQVCGCRIIAGEGVTITGSGGATDPLTISAEGGDSGVSGWFPGDLKAVATASVPGGWLLANGQAVSRTSFAALFAAIGTTYGAGNGATTFNVPDMRDRVPVGVSGTKTLGSGGGAESVTLITTNLPPHTHTINHDHAPFDTNSGGSHKHQLDLSNEDGSNNNTVRRGGSHTIDTNLPVESAGAHVHTINVPAYTGNSGDGPGNSFPVSVMQPYRAVNWLVKT